MKSQLPVGLLALLTTWLFTSSALAFGSDHKKVLLKNVNTLTLRKEKMTTHRRVAAVPQLKCTSGNGCRYYQIEIMQCKNVGAEYDENDIQWHCQADMPEEFKLGSTEVTCEGFSNSKDPFILKGSCGAEYGLFLTDKGLERYGGGSGSGLPFSSRGGEGKTGSLFTILFWMVFVGIVFWMAQSFLRNWTDTNNRRQGNNNRRQPRPPRNDGGGGWFPPPGDDDPPPPYSPNPPRKTQSTRPRPAGAQQQQGFRPGFWTGLLGGGATGYLAGRQGTRANQRPGNDNARWGGMGTTQAGQRSSWSDNGEGSSSSATFHTSSGFGGTSNR